MPLPELSRIHVQYLALSQVSREQFSGSLGNKVCFSTGPDGLPCIVAASIAGSASLWADADGELLRGAMRAGLCDFVVGTLDEALRILKNEVRRKRAVSVGLQADSARCMRECIDRGFQPDLLLSQPPTITREVQTLVERGAVRLDDRRQPKTNSSLLCWSVDLNEAKTMRRIGQIAVESLSPARDDTPDRQRWLEAAPQYLGRAFANRQCLRMDHNESAAFVARARLEHPAVIILSDNAGT